MLTRSRTDVALVACCLMFTFICLWVRFALPFMFRAIAPDRRTAIAANATPNSCCGVGAPSAAATALPHLPDDVALVILKRLPLVDLAAFSRCSQATHALARSPEVWRRIVVPDHAPSIRKALAALPAGVEQRCTIAVRGGLYREGQRSALSRFLGMESATRTGIRIARPVILEPAGDGDEVTVESDACEAITILPGAEGTVVRGLCVRTAAFASHAVAIYADGVEVDACTLHAAGRNGCGVVVTGAGVRSRVSACTISECGGGGVLLAYGVGPVEIAYSTLRGNAWSGVGAFSGASAVIQACDIRDNCMYAVGVARDVHVTMRDQAGLEKNGLGGLHRYLAPPLHPQMSLQSR